MADVFVSHDRPAMGKIPAGVDTYRVDGGWYEFASGGRMTWEKPGLREATPEEVEAWKATRAEAEERRRRTQEREARLLALARLTHADFSRFRNVHREGDRLFVTTRENGTNTRSVGAIRNPNYVQSQADDFDSTYEDYEFRIPARRETGGDDG